MLAEQIAAITRQYIDEPTQNNVSNLTLSGWLDQAYREFRAIVTQRDQNYLSRTHTIVNPTIAQIQLKGTLLPPNPTQPQMQRLTRVMYNPPGQIYPVILQPSGSLEGLKSQLFTTWAAAYFLDRGTGILWTTGNMAGNSITIQYIPEPQINWLTAIVPASNVALDDGLDDWHELIALLAARRYFIVDGVENQQIEKLVKENKATLMAYIGKSTSNSSNYVRHESSQPW